MYRGAKLTAKAATGARRIVSSYETSTCARPAASNVSARSRRERLHSRDAYVRGVEGGVGSEATRNDRSQQGDRCPVERPGTEAPPVDAVSPDGERSLVSRSCEARVSRTEQAYESAARLVACTDVSPLVQMAHDAFYEHRPIALSPDAVWFTIAQGFATHVNLNADALRGRFVRHEGRLKLHINHPGILLGQRSPWPEAFGLFSTQIAEHVGKLRDLVVADFSTTGPLERAATEVLLMDTFQAYFEYEMRAGCGIPQITLLGTPDDWRSLRRRAQTLSEYGLKHWAFALLPVLDRIVAAAEGADDPPFWRSFFHYESGSGGSALTGWINVLFPYLVDWKTNRATIPNEFMAPWQQNFAKPPRGWNDTPGPGMGQLPGGLASAPVKVVDDRTGESHDMRFVGGMFGVTEDAAGVLSPEFGWAITYER
jgi:Domain of unknown function (DUF4419)